MAEQRPGKTPGVGEGWRFENKGLECKVTRENFKRHKMFSAEDFMYALKFENLDKERAPLLRDVLNTLEHCLTSVIKDLQAIYHDEEAEEFIRHIYVSFDSGDFTKSGISTGNYMLTEPHRTYDAQAKLVARHSLEILKNMLVSYQHLKLDEKFCVRITVLRYVKSNYVFIKFWLQLVLYCSTSHIRYRLERSKMRSPYILIGHADDNVITKRFITKHIFKAPELERFNQTCLPFSIIIGFHYEAYLHVLLSSKEKFVPEERFKIAANFYKQVKVLQTNPSDQKAGGLLEKKWADIFSDTNLSPNGPFALKECVDTLGNYFGVNIYILDSKNFGIYYKYPEKRNESAPTVYLLLSNKNHVDLILDRFKAFSSYGSPCLFCNQIIKRQDRHRCYSKKICFVCNKYKVDIETEHKPFMTIKTRTTFCIKDIEFKDPVCKKCGLRCRSESCFKKHKGIGQCSLKHKCPSCKRVYLKKHEHVCDLKFCIRCKTNYDGNKPHFCKMLPQKKIKEGCALAVYDFETIQDESFNSCFKCFYKEKEYLKISYKTRSQLSKQEQKALLCDIHENSDLEAKSFHTVNFISCIYETCHGTFNLIEFSDPKLKYENDMKIVEGYKIIPKDEYYLEEKYGQQIERSKHRKRKKRRDACSSENMFPILMKKGNSGGRDIYIGQDFDPIHADYIKENFSALEKFLIFFINENFRNTTFLGIFPILNIHTHFVMNIFHIHSPQCQVKIPEEFRPE